MPLTTNSNKVTYPIIDAEGIKCRALINIGVNSSYASFGLINKINKKNLLTRIETLMIYECISTKLWIQSGYSTSKLNKLDKQVRNSF